MSLLLCVRRRLRHAVSSLGMRRVRKDVVLTAVLASVVSACVTTGGPSGNFAGPPPADCGYKFVGSWTVYSSVGTYPVTIRPDGTSTAHCSFCMPVQRWTCSGDTYVVLDPFRVESPLTPDQTRMNWYGGYTLRNGPPPVRQPEQAAILPSQQVLPPSNQGAQAQLTAATQNQSACPDGFSWVGGYLCAAYNVDAGSCASKGGRFIAPKIVGAPTRCELDSQTANPTPNRPATTAQGGATTSGSPAIAGVPGGGIAPVSPQRPSQGNMGVGSTSASGGHCVDYFSTMKREFWELALQCANQAEALTNMVDFFNAYGVQRGYSPDEIKRSAGNTIYPLVRDNDPGWFKSGNSTLPNCSQPLQVERQSKSFTECLRVYSCAYAAASCGEEAGPQFPNTPCSAISAQCLAKNPIPQ